MRQGTRDLRAFAAAAGGLLFLAAACDRGDLRVSDAPLGWPGATGADEVRKWSRESLESAPRWKAEDAPLFELVPEVVEGAAPGLEYRYPSDATFLPDGRVVLYYYAGEYLSPIRSCCASWIPRAEK